MIRTPSRVITHAPHLVELVREKVAAEMPLPERTVQVVRPAQPPATWEQLHLWGLEPETPGDRVWLMSFGGRIPGSCQCRSHWLEVLDRCPPRFGDKFAWSVDAHNAVNRHLKKPELTLLAAHAFWIARRDEINRQPNLLAS